MNFSRCSLLVSTCAFLALLAWAQSTAQAAKSLGDLTGPWQLFIDDYLVSSKTNVVRQYHPFEKYSGNPILVVDKPWEHEVVACCAVLPAEDGSGYRMWYYCWGHKNDPDGGHSLYATSKDGIHWEKPNLGLKPWKVNGTMENNIVTAAGSIMHTPDDPEPARRYKSVDSGPYRFDSSPDGLHWERLTKGEIFKAGDTGHVMWDPLTKKYRGYAKVNAMVSGLRRRAIGYSDGTGFESWPPLYMVMAPDDFDDRWVKPGTVQRTHFYNCPITAYQTMYVGLLSIFRGEDEEEGYFHGPIFTELVSSRDGIHWLREEGDRPAILSCGPKRTWDHGMVFCSSFLQVGDELRVYYSGYDGLHDYLPFHSAIGMATLRKDGFVSLDGEDTPGIVITRPLKGLTGQLHLNCKAGAGLLRVEVLDADGNFVQGYRKVECNEPRGDGIDQVITWREHKELPGGKAPLRLKFLMKNASLYSFRTDEPIQVVAEHAGPTLGALFTFEGGGNKDKLPADGVQTMRFLGTAKVDNDKSHAAFGEHSIALGSAWRPINRLEISDTTKLGKQFTLAAMIKSDDNKPARLFSAYSGNSSCKTDELIFDFDPKGKTQAGLRLVCKGIPIESDRVTFDDMKYHHLAVTYDDGAVCFYLDGKSAGREWVPGGAPVSLARNLLVGEDAELGSDEQLTGHLDDVLVLGKTLEAADIESLSHKGAEPFFKNAAAAQP